MKPRLAAARAAIGAALSGVLGCAVVPYQPSSPALRVEPQAAAVAIPVVVHDLAIFQDPRIEAFGEMFRLDLRQYGAAAADALRVGFRRGNVVEPVLDTPSTRGAHLRVDGEIRDLALGRNNRASAKFEIRGTLLPDGEELFRAKCERVSKPDAVPGASKPEGARRAFDALLKACAETLVAEVVAAPRWRGALDRNPEVAAWRLDRTTAHATQPVAPRASRSATNQRKVVAVFPIEDRGTGFEAAKLTGLTEFAAAALAESGRFEIVPTSEITAVLREQKQASYRQCYDESCQIEIGKELAAEKTISTAVTEFGGKCLVSMRMYDLRRGTQVAAGTATGGCSEADVLASVEAAIGKLLEQ